MGGGGGGATWITVPQEGVAAWTRDPSVSTDVGPQSVPEWVSVVLAEETGVWCAGRLASVPVDVDEQMLIGVACPAGVAECMDDVVLPMLAVTVPPSDGAEQVADDTASMADAGILFPADSAGMLSPPDPAGILFPAVPAGIPFLAGPVGPVGPVGTLSPSDPAGILFLAVPAGMPFPASPVGPVGPVGTLSPSDPVGILFSAVPAGIPFPAGPVGPVGTLSSSDPARNYCFLPFLLGYRSWQALLGRCP